MTTFPKRISLRIENQAGEGHWKELCIVYDNEALGLLKRKLFDWSIKVDDVAPSPHFLGIPADQLHPGCLKPSPESERDA